MNETYSWIKATIINDHNNDDNNHNHNHDNDKDKDNDDHNNNNNNNNKVTAVIATLSDINMAFCWRCTKCCEGVEFHVWFVGSYVDFVPFFPWVRVFKKEYTMEFVRIKSLRRKKDVFFSIL